MRRRKDGGHVPSFAEKVPLDLREIPPPPELLAVMVNRTNSYLRTYTLGRCSVIVTRELDEWHLSIVGPGRYPTWDEVAEARYRLIPDDVTMAMLLPPKAEYINLNRHCFQMLQVGLAGEAADE